jgi:hypothetical protein
VKKVMATWRCTLVIGWLEEAFTATVPLDGWSVVDAFDVLSMLTI